jgi:hypothetical protein
MNTDMQPRYENAAWIWAYLALAILFRNYIGKKKMTDNFIESGQTICRCNHNGTTTFAIQLVTYFIGKGQLIDIFSTAISSPILYMYWCWVFR